MKIYAISGKAEHGKNFTADLIKEYYEENFGQKACLLANGDYVKFLSKLAGWNGNKDEEGRKFLQEFGTNYIRNTIDANFWVDEVARQISILKKYFNVFIIVDVRFENEIRELARRYSDVIAVRVKRINEDGSEYKSILTEEQLNYPSETALDDFRFFDNLLFNRNKEDLTTQVVEMINKVEGIND